jgi:hypothetical protein
MEVNIKKISFGVISDTIIKIMIISAFILLIGGSFLLVTGQDNSANQTATRGFYLLIVAFVWRSILYLKQRY